MEIHQTPKVQRGVHFKAMGFLCSEKNTAKGVITEALCMNILPLEMETEGVELAWPGCCCLSV